MHVCMMIEIKRNTYLLPEFVDRFCAFFGRENIRNDGEAKILKEGAQLRILRIAETALS